MGFREFGTALLDFAAYITGKPICNDELSIICWLVVYVTPELAFEYIRLYPWQTN